MNRADLISGILLVCLSIWLLLYAIPNYTVGGMSYGLSPAGLPKLMTSCILFLSLIQILNSLSALLGKKTVHLTPEEPGVDLSHWIFWMKIISIFILTLLGMQFIGFIVGAIFFMASLQFLCGQRNYIILGILSVSIPILLKLAFWNGMGILLPQGVLF